MRVNWETVSAKVKWWLLFLAFREPNPKHKVVESADILVALAAIFPSFILFTTMVMLYMFSLVGFVGIFIVYFVTLIGTLETLHIIYDR